MQAQNFMPWNAVIIPVGSLHVAPRTVGSTQVELPPQSSSVSQILKALVPPPQRMYWCAWQDQRPGHSCL